MLMFSFLIFITKYTQADEYSDKEAGLLNISLDEYKEKVIDEKKILDGLKKLLEIYIFLFHFFMFFFATFASLRW